MDESRPQRRKNIRSLLLGELGDGRGFDSAQRNFLLWKSPKILKKSSNFRSDKDIVRSGMESLPESCSEKTSSQGSCFMKSWKGSFSRSLCWIKWNFLSSSSLRNFHASRPAPLENSCSLPSIPKHEVCNNLCPKIEPSAETEHRKENLDGIKAEANEAKDSDHVKENEVKDCDDLKENEAKGSDDVKKIDVKDCDDLKENEAEDYDDVKKNEIQDCDDVKKNEVQDCDDVSKKEGLCCERGFESFFKEEQCGGGDGVEGRCESEDECDAEEEHGHNNGGLRKKPVRRYPPPLPSLARTGNLPCHMPWVHLRSYKTDGRLVIQEVKVRHHEFFRAKRANGRLTLHLVQHDEDKVRAHQAGLFKAELAKEAAIDPVKETIDIHEESKEMGAEEGRDEAENVQNSSDLEDEEKRNGDTEIEGAEKRIGGEVERVSSDGGRDDELLPCFRSFARERLIPDSLQMHRQRFSGSHLQANSSAVGYGSKGLESPVGCCSPIPNPLFDRPISAIRPILS